MSMDRKMERYLDKQITEFMNQVDVFVEDLLDLNIEHKMDFLIGYLYSSIIFLAHEYLNSSSRKKSSEMTREQYDLIYNFFMARIQKIKDALYYRGIT